MELLFSERPKVWEIWDEQQKIEIGDYENEKEYLDAVSPIKLVDRITTPLYIVHGVRDWRVDIKHAQKLRRELEKNGKKEGKDFWWLVKTDEGHGFVGEANKMELYTELEEFFGRYLEQSS
jgi:dipeptidyl aminopeptidase/acylaminoacyl peptidase